jgi:hypothetical protein
VTVDLLRRPTIVSSIAPVRSDVIVGVDTHKHEHVAVVIDGLGGRLGELYIAANNEGYFRLLEWASSFGRVHLFGVHPPISELADGWFPTQLPFEAPALPFHLGEPAGDDGDLAVVLEEAR